MRGHFALFTILLGCHTVLAGIASADPAAGARELRLAQAASPLPVPDAQPDNPPAGDPVIGGPSTDGPTAGEPDDGSDDVAEPTQDDPEAGAPDDDGSPDDLSLGEIPVIETMELTPDVARRALDVYLMVKEKYKDSELDQYENLQDFVDQSPEGKTFEADIKTAGFDNVNDWNLAIVTLGFAYSSSIDDPTADILQQIAELEQDTELAQDMKDRMIASLRAMIPSENNKKVVADMLADPVYADKLKQLDIEEE